MADNIFKYDESMSFMENYNPWYDMNCKECPHGTNSLIHMKKD